MKSLNARRKRFCNRRAVFLFVTFFLAPATNSHSLFAQSKSQAKAPQITQSSLRAVLQSSFGSAVEAATTFSPFYLTGDFNGDGAQDILIVVRLKGSRSELAPDVKIYNPFERPKAVYPTNPASNPVLALAIIHGSKAGWQTPPALERFLLFGGSPVLILNYSRITGLPQDKKDLMELLKKRSTKYRADGWPPVAAKGDSIVLGTEATDSILYWNGKNYRWEEAAGGE